MKKKILVLSDHPMSPSGVGTQTKYMIEGLLATGRFQFVCLGGALQHTDMTPTRVEGHEDDWTIYPVEGYGSQDMVRSLMRRERPDLIWIMTDPRFWGWLWEMEDELRPLVPILYYHVWDNYPYPTYNRASYLSNDHIVTISKLTDDIVRTVAPEVGCTYLPHAVNTKIFTPVAQSEDARKFKEEHGIGPDKFLVFWNNRNARRKQSGTLIFWWKAFLDKVGHDKATLMMHTDVKDPHGQDLHAIIKELGMVNGEVLFSQQKIPQEHLSMLYNASDCTINVSDAEGFGLSTLESMACGTPIIVNKTGGLQDQITDGKEFFGIGLEPCSRAVIGSQEIPWIYEDRLSEEQVVNALVELYEMSPEDRAEMGRKGSEFVNERFNFKKYQDRWVEIVDSVIEESGAWRDRKGYRHWEIKEV